MTFAFVYAPKNQAGAGERAGQVWIVNHGGKEYVFPRAEHRPEPSRHRCNHRLYCLPPLTQLHY